MIQIFSGSFKFGKDEVDCSFFSLTLTLILQLKSNPAMKSTIKSKILMNSTLYL